MRETVPVPPVFPQRLEETRMKGTPENTDSALHPAKGTLHAVTRVTGPRTGVCFGVSVPLWGGPDGTCIEEASPALFSPVTEAIVRMLSLLSSDGVCDDLNLNMTFPYPLAMHICPSACLAFLLLSV